MNQIYRKQLNSSIGALCLLLTVFTYGTNLQADKLCIKKRQTISGKKVLLRKVLRTASSCPSGFSEVLDSAVFTGPTGEQGAQGEQGIQGQQGIQGVQGTQGIDGAFRVYGNGSDGDRTVSGSEAVSSVETQYEDLTIPFGSTLTVPSGTVIRCSGTFTLNGTIIVSEGATAGRRNINGTQRDSNITPPHPGLSIRAASSGAYVNTVLDGSASVFQEGFGGVGTGAVAAQFLLSRQHLAGGGGAAGINGSGGAGGGAVFVYSAGAVTIGETGNIQAIGANAESAGGGGGAGGLVVIASQTSISHAGTISVEGGDGGNNSSQVTAGGGGAGGVVHLIAPSASNSGFISVTGGSGGSAGPALSDPIRGAGGGGGGLVGDGGTSAASAGSSAEAGDSGSAIITQTDPTSLL